MGSKQIFEIIKQQHETQCLRIFNPDLIECINIAIMLLDSINYKPYSFRSNGHKLRNQLIEKQTYEEIEEEILQYKVSCFYNKRTNHKSPVIFDLLQNSPLESVKPILQSGTSIENEYNEIDQQPEEDTLKICLRKYPFLQNNIENQGTDNLQAVKYSKIRN